MAEPIDRIMMPGLMELIDLLVQKRLDEMKDQSSDETKLTIRLLAPEEPKNALPTVRAIGQV